MWKNLVLNRILQLCTNTEESFMEATKHFKCQPRYETDGEFAGYETVHFYGLLSNREGVYGIDDVKIDISSETVGFRTITDLTEPVHVFAAIPVQDSDEIYANDADNVTCEMPVATLITTDDIYQMADVLKTTEAKERALSLFYFLPMDQKTTVYHFMHNDVFGKNVIKCCSFMASARIDPWFDSDRNDDLIEQYNERAGSGNKIDLYRVLSFLDLVGDELLLSENSAAIFSLPNWLSFLGTYSLVEGCSVWSIQEKSLTQTILKEVPHNFLIPTHMLCWILSAEQQNAMIKDLLKCKNKKKSDEIRIRLIHFLCYGTDLRLKVVQNTVHHLMKAGLTKKDLNDLSTGNSAAKVESVMQSVYGFTR